MEVSRQEHPTPTDSRDSPPAIRNDIYYWDPVTFLVEGQLFKVPRYGFTAEPSVFQTTFSLPQGDQQAEGSCDENPLRLEGISAVDFQGLLKVMYPLRIASHLTLPWEDWRSALRLATMYDFSRIRDLAIEEMSKITDADPVQIILVAREFSIEEWLLPAYRRLACRDQPISLADAQLLGWETAIGLSHVREDISPIRLMSADMLSKANVNQVRMEAKRMAMAKRKAKMEWKRNRPMTAEALLPRAPSRWSVTVEGDSHGAVVDDDVRKVLLAKQHRMKDLLFQSYRQLALRTKPLSVDEARQLGWEAGVRLCHVREAMERFGLPSHDEPNKAVSEEVVLPVIWDVFSQDLGEEPAEWGVIERIRLAKEKNVKSWLIQGYDELARRLNPISVDEAKQLGWETTVGIFRVRETLRRRDQPVVRSVQHCDDTLRRIMGEELDVLEAVEVTLVKRILIARDNHVSSWLSAGYREWAERLEPPIVEECRELGWNASIKAFQVREDIVRYVSSEVGKKREDHNFDGVIERIIGLKAESNVAGTSRDRETSWRI